MAMCWTLSLSIGLASGTGMQQGLWAVQACKVCQLLLQLYLNISSQDSFSTHAALQVLDKPMHEDAKAADDKVLQSTFLQLHPKAVLGCWSEHLLTFRVCRKNHAARGHRVSGPG